VLGGDPLFADSAAGDFRPLPCSPLRDGGDPTFQPTGSTDLALAPRLQGPRVDMGAFEAMPTEITLEASGGVSCEGGTGGAFSVSGAHICTPLTYQWIRNGTESGTGGQQLLPGMYAVTITDAKGTTFTTTVVIEQGGSPTIQLTAQPVLCNTSVGGAVTVNGITGGTAPFTYQWFDSEITDSVRTNLPYGLYTVTITDALGCTAVQSAWVEQNGIINIVDMQMDVSCFGESDGMAGIFPSNGLAPITYEWANGHNGPTLNDLPAGQYAGTLTDALGCSVNWIVSIEQPDSLLVNSMITPAGGPNIASGAVLLDIIGGNSPYSVQWSNGASGANINALLPGIYTATITDANTCTQTIMATVNWVTATQTPPEPTLMTLQPNPATHYADLTLYERGYLHIYTAQGVLMYENGFEAGIHRLVLTNWPTGVYTGIFTAKNGAQQAIRIVVQH
jgi:hypothetical protein